MKSKFGTLQLVVLVITFSTVLPLILLFKTYPSEIPCGKVVHVSNVLTVPINCDSSIFLKDADNPRRLVNGDSIYSDRPILSSLVYGIDKLLENLGIPDTRSKFKGNSGLDYEYSQRKYLIFIFFNFIFLFCALLLALVNFLPNNGNKKLSATSVLFLVNVGLLIGANEVIKTFFWTPHTQLLNILLPSFIFWELGLISLKFVSSKVFYVFILLISLLTLTYPIFALALIPLLFVKYKTSTKRFFLVTIGLVPFSIYPFLVRFFGGEFTNQQAHKFREFVWLIDIFSGRSPSSMLLSKLNQLLISFSMIPIALMIIFGFFYYWLNRKKSLVISSYWRGALFVFAAYFFFLFGIGICDRRLTFGLIVFIGLCSLKLFQGMDRFNLNRISLIALSCLATFQFLSFLLTLGPLK